MSSPTGLSATTLNSGANPSSTSKGIKREWSNGTFLKQPINAAAGWHAAEETGSGLNGVNLFISGAAIRARHPLFVFVSGVVDKIIASAKELDSKSEPEIRLARFSCRLKHECAVVGPITERGKVFIAFEQLKIAIAGTKGSSKNFYRCRKESLIFNFVQS